MTICEHFYFRTNEEIRKKEQFLTLLLDYLNLHLDPLVRKVSGVARRVHYLVGYLHAAGNLAEDRILAVQEVRILHDYEELRARAVRVLGTGHREYAPLVRDVVELCRHIPARPAGAVHPRVRPLGVRVSALDHEARDDPVEYRPVVETLF